MKIGDYVHYAPEFGNRENGRIADISPSGETAWVVYHCNNDWDNYTDYTGQSTRMEDLQPGWVDANGRILPEYCDHNYIPTTTQRQSVIQAQCSYCGHIIN